ncbi:hypothetical protein BASA50_010564 [Batrachochytrium salamandrivorans]|uniref:J domain-containing protein n=1 Tax=Batrachochytrium salamandrivorans TaxID=1357716 RepID=A0ABQ8F1A5_9FUNG|nr:hypothetical protein BASA50_010564 [Batrachochytrium salamandrivorans]KAH9247670.1 hypothetical protein BASA81_014703 [Batrachochytrium salamandrivorans]KAH9265825.1 hypothetical protein BASA83_010958 [Batrachochytrium salamandrivorans]
MVVDFYRVLEIDRAADEHGIKRAYRKMALKLHPERNPALEAKERFGKVAEAYHVLCDAKRKAIYDQYGLEGLKKGVPSKFSFDGYEGGYEFPGNAEEIFSQFFGGKNPFSDFFAHQGVPDKTVFGPKFGGLYGMNQGPRNHTIKKDQPVEIELILTLEDIYLGCIKKIKISRKVLNDDGVTTTPRDKLLTVEVSRGWKIGTRVIFSKEGDQGPHRIPADMVFIVKEQAHQRFSRVGDDLVYCVDIPLVKALTGWSLDILTLDGRLLKIPVNNTVTPDQVIRIPNEGMPIYKSPSKHGDLLIKFKTVFPKTLTNTQKMLLKQAFFSS